MRRVVAVCLACVVWGWETTAQQVASSRTAGAAGTAPMAAAPQPAPVTFPMLSVDGIMRGPRLVGSPPSAVRWSPDSSTVYFQWQKPEDDRPSTWSVKRDGTGLTRLSPEAARTIVAGVSGRPDPTGRRLLAVENGDVVVYDLRTFARRVIVRTAAAESSARWAQGGRVVTFVRDGHLFQLAFDADGDGPAERQLTEVRVAGAPGAAAGAADAQGQSQGLGGGRLGAQQGTQETQTGRGIGGAQGTASVGPRGGGAAVSESQRVLREEEKGLLAFVRKQADDRARTEAERGGRQGAGTTAGDSRVDAERIARFTPGPRQTVTDQQVSGDGRHAYLLVAERPEVAARTQDVPQYVTESTYTEMANGRSNVGDAQPRRLLAILEMGTDKVIWADATAFAGHEPAATPAVAPAAAVPADTAAPAASPGPARGQATRTGEPRPREVAWGMPECSDDGSRCVTTVRSADFHDRWLVLVDPATGASTVIDHAHDPGWIREGSVSGSMSAASGGPGGFGGGGAIAWLPDNARIIFMSEKTGWMHLYALDVSAAKPVATPLTAGEWEVASARLSNDRTRLHFSSNEVHPGERQFYTLPVQGGTPTRVTTATGAHDVTVSPDETTLAVVHSYTSKPPELSLVPFQPGAAAVQVTTTPTPEWLAFKWADPRIISFKARDGASVYARLYTPEMVGARRNPRRPAVVFAHGAGYLQFATKSWSSNYYREHMFHHLLASRGYVVICPDYRASAGYGREWRTAIHGHMGGKDLDDVVDAARYVVSTEGVNPKRIGVYGGSYGGFLTLMALFTTPDVFVAGAALRPVTDWAHYNHSYTAPILGVPQTNLEAYKRSSPMYFAEGLKHHLLICHGVVDSNVFFQDTVRLAQRLIELRKPNWSVAPYPVENHGFTEETSWADEYKRILDLFETHLRR